MNIKKDILIVVGGTGMYIKALLNGLHILPDISKQVKDKVLQTHNIYEHLKKVDPLIASRLKPNDIQRVQRAYEIYVETGKSMLSFYDKNNALKPLNGCETHVIFMNPDREFLYKLSDERFEGFVKNGAIEEVKNIGSLNPKILGVREIKRYLNNEISLKEAIFEAQLNTRHYIKRQFTWFRNQLPANRIELQYKNQKEYNSIVQDIIHCLV